MKMNTKKTSLLGLTLCTLLVAFNADAASWSGWGTVTSLTAQDEGYRVYFTNLNNPENCGNTDYAELKAGIGSASRELMNKTLLASFLSGKDVNLLVSTGECGLSDRPAYQMVRARQ